MNMPPEQKPNDIEVREWIESLQEVLDRAGPEQVRRILRETSLYANSKGVDIPFSANTPYLNTIPLEEQPPYPGIREIEQRIKSIIRWNAMAMVVRANRKEEGIGGHISSYASAATLYEVGFNHFFRGSDHPCGGDLIYFQGHASPGIYARAYLEGRLPAERLGNFRHELHEDPGLSSYPHPWLMPDFWRFPTVSMGLGPLSAIYHARFIRYLEDRGLREPSDQKIWAFLGDGETDEPETLGSITLAARENLDNLIFVVNCNLQRLDGPVRGNGKIIQELETAFRGVGWNVVKVIWGSDWDPLLAEDTDGILLKRMQECVDGQYQKYIVEDGAFIREDFFAKDPELLKRVAHLSDEQLKKLNRGGHDVLKVHAAYKEAVEHRGSPTVILAKTVKGYGMGDGGEGMNITHQQKKLNEEQLMAFRNRFNIPISDEDVNQLPFYRPADDSPEMQYLQSRRKALGGYNPTRSVLAMPLKTPEDELFNEFFSGTADREVSTTMAIVRMLTKLLKDKELGDRIVPIVPDEARTFGMDALFRQCGIYSHVGQLYEPVDKKSLLYYREAQDGQILEEGITEAGSLCSFIAAGTAYANHGIAMIPFYIFYSMFGLQRIGDLAWAAADSRCRGFLVGATAGRTTLAGEGLQHQDGNSHLLAYPIPNLMAYDPAYAYEIAVILQDGMRRMFTNGEDIFYYISVMNENYAQPKMPDGARDGILKGMHKVAAAEGKGGRVRLLGSGTILNEAIKARDLMVDVAGLDADIYSVTSYKELQRDAIETERWNTLHPTEAPRTPFLADCLADGEGPIVAASDYVRAVPGSVARWMPADFTALGTDGFGRSDGRKALRDFFEVDARHIAVAALSAAAREGTIKSDVVVDAMKKWDIDPERESPLRR
ncbi:MAG: pyruvate dehydrogenase (acetyl-transferring), homodimeric type [Kiritimatiellia bacterium]|jgi:pyruvate dehydrogenase E1 component|nr:pyruvate dehydrogenase (acetyl-transferring), homodimeric type [Kiritimatiellia bacterium]MDP6809551.1 pyruvate dehydrogenase (acetyl-transferring), homodimeric type [Kiritimatiellia bacterium]MDP7023598.1 pyruvate dehydrogenase (acetyl-transferring), homodimeric type [Kiritimatiellia bacterium]